MIRSDAPSLLPEQLIAELFTRPVLASSIPTRVATIVHTASRSVRVPKMGDRASAAWVNELEEIPTSTPKFGDLEVVPEKVAGLVPISNELRDDAGPEVQAIIGNQLVEATANALDKAFLTKLNKPAPQGLASITPTTVTVDQIDKLATYVDVAGTAIDKRAPITSWLMSPATRTKLLTIVGAVSTVTAGAFVDLNRDARAATTTQLEGAEIIVSDLIPANTVWAIPRSRVLAVVRKDVEVRTSEHALWGRDGLSLRSVMRVGFGVTDPAAVVKISQT